MGHIEVEAAKCASKELCNFRKKCISIHNDMIGYNNILQQRKRRQGKHPHRSQKSKNILCKLIFIYH